MLAHHIDAHIHELGRIQRTSAGLRLGRRMGGCAAKAKLYIGQGHGRTVANPCLCAGVPGEDNIVVFKVAVAQHINFANCRFFSWCAIKLDRALDQSFIHRMRNGHSGPDGAHTKNRMAARMPGLRIGARRNIGRCTLRQTRQRIKFRQNSNARTTAAIARDKCRRHIGNACLNSKSSRFEKRLQFLRGFRFFQARLGIGPDLSVRSTQAVCLAIQITPCFLFGFIRMCNKVRLPNRTSNDGNSEVTYRHILTHFSFEMAWNGLLDKLTINDPKVSVN